MRSETLRRVKSVTPDYGDLPFLFEEEAFERFAEQMDAAIEGLVSRWIGGAAPASRFPKRPSSLFSCARTLRQSK